MLHVTMKDGSDRWVAAAHIVHFAADGHGMTTIYFDTGTMITVQDKPLYLAEIIHGILTGS